MVYVASNGAELWLPEVSYDAVGRHFYQAEWQSGYFHSGDVLPHYETIKEQIESGVVLPEDAPEGFSDGEDAYVPRQKRARRSSRVFSWLIEALEYKKTIAWQKNPEGEWSTIPGESWCEGGEYRQTLKTHLKAVITDNDPAPNAIGIEREKLEKHIRGWAVPSTPGQVEPEIARATGRPALDNKAAEIVLRGWFDDGAISRWESEKLIRKIRPKTGWRLDVCKRLARQPINWFPTANTRKYPPNPITLVGNLSATVPDLIG
jgi:hypothetical protein